jgi:hypothetical protein
VTALPQDGSPNYAMERVDISRSQLDTWVAEGAAMGAVVTALSVSPSSGLLRAYAFWRPGDTTAYETKVVNITPADFFAQATMLADAGFTITAFGRSGIDTAVMIGTRTPGAAPRTVTLQTTLPNLRAGDAVVAWISHSPDILIIVER